VAEEDRAGVLQADLALLIMLLIHVSHEIDRCQPSGDLLLDMAFRGLAMRLNTHYHAAGAPYGDDEAGFRQWVYERWPAPSAA
jgi:hypothetical protein